MLEDGRIAGIVTERDYLRRCALERRPDEETLCGRSCPRRSSSPRPETTIDECMALMTDRRIRHLPVVEGGEIVGLVSIGDLVKFKFWSGKPSRSST